MGCWFIDFRHEFEVEQNQLKNQIDLSNHFEDSDIRYVAGVDLAYWTENDKEYGGIHFWKLGDNTKQWLLNRKYPKSMEIISKNPETSYIYKLASDDDLETSIDMIKLVFPEGTNIFKDITIPAASSKDGQAHLVQSEEEFLQYYKSNAEWQWDKNEY